MAMESRSSMRALVVEYTQSGKRLAESRPTHVWFETQSESWP